MKNLEINHNLNILKTAKDIIMPPKPNVKFYNDNDKYNPMVICVLVIGIAILYSFIPDLAFAASDWAGSVKSKVDEGRTGILTIVGAIVAVVAIIAGVVMMVKGQIEPMKLWVFFIGGAMIAGAGAFADFVTN